MEKTQGLYSGGACWGGGHCPVGGQHPTTAAAIATLLLDLETGHDAHTQASVPHITPAPPLKLSCAFKYYLNKLIDICFLRKGCTSLRMS